MLKACKLFTAGARDAAGSQQADSRVPVTPRLPGWSRYEGSSEIVKGEESGRRRRRSAPSADTAGELSRPSLYKS